MLEGCRSQQAESEVQPIRDLKSYQVHVSTEILLNRTPWISFFYIFSGKQTSFKFLLFFSPSFNHLWIWAQFKALSFGLLLSTSHRVGTFMFAKTENTRIPKIILIISCNILFPLPEQAQLLPGQMRPNGDFLLSHFQIKLFAVSTYFQ